MLTENSNFEEENLSEEKLAELQSAFEIFDKDSDGKITLAELDDILKKLGYKQSDKNLKQIINQVDADGNGEVDFKEFLELMCKKMKAHDDEEDIMEAFRIFDKNLNGFVSANELKNIMINMGEKITEEELNDLLKDNEESGKINYKEFTKLMK